ncbi:transcriptional regulator NrdR [Sporosarcina ureae]|uniref:transcriptional regulator NrdR n=1 Tax=Sporosarcina ureae TaxID=1571 RepID=UPI0009DC71EC|nr:transcriptional regulator NrdR [Sporosarcina ureae]ARF16351.1 transcriptional regulator NrdR [Sporosarcina ureae]
MLCPACHYNGTRVIDSRPAEENRSIRRRRECEKCSYRFTTFEKVEHSPLVVVKKDKTREEFSSEKLLRGLIRACEKRAVPIEHLKEIVSSIEKELRSSGNVEIDSEQVGEMVMERLVDVDEVAYVRFASVYRHYKDITVFIDELQQLQNRKDEQE